MSLIANSTLPTSLPTILLYQVAYPEAYLEDFPEHHFTHDKINNRCNCVTCIRTCKALTLLRNHTANPTSNVLSTNTLVLTPLF